MCACDCVRVMREYRVDADDRVLTVEAAGPGADSLRVVTMHPAATAGEVEVRGWRYRLHQPDPDWWVAVVPLAELPDELQQIAPPPRVEGITGAGVTAGEDRSRPSRAA